METTETIGGACRRALEAIKGGGAGAREMEGLDRAARWLEALYERANGTEAFSAAGLDAALGEIRGDYESGRVYEAAYSSRYRMVAAVEDMADYGEVGLARLSPWRPDRNPLLQAVPDEVRRDQGSVTGLCLAVVEELGRAGYSRGVIGAYRHHALPKLAMHARNKGTDRYSDELVEEFVAKAQGNGWLDVKPGMRRYLRPAALHVSSMHHVGALHPPHDRPGRAKLARVGPFGSVIAEFELWRERGGAKPKTVKTDVAAIAPFLDALCPEGPAGLTAVTRERVRCARASVSEGRSPRWICRTLSSIRSFASFVEAAHPEVPAFGRWIGPNPRTVKARPIEGYSPEQADAIVASVDRSTAAGKRDAAILALLKGTGMRACDAAALTLDDIDWRNREIRVVQEKTGVPTALPFDADAGDAIAEYLLGARRECGSRALFVTVTGRARPLSAQGLLNVAARRGAAALGDGFRGAHGAHAFRRGLGAALVAAEVPLAEVADVLGHSGPDSTMPYVTVAVERLRECCAGLGDIHAGGAGDAEE